MMAFDKLYYRGKEVRRDGFTTDSVRTIVMQKNNPDRLDMRYKTNREFVAQQRAWTKAHKNG